MKPIKSETRSQSGAIRKLHRLRSVETVTPHSSRTNTFFFFFTKLYSIQCDEHAPNTTPTMAPSVTSCVVVLLQTILSCLQLLHQNVQLLHNSISLLYNQQRERTGATGAPLCARATSCSSVKALLCGHRSATRSFVVCTTAVSWGRRW